MATDDSNVDPAAHIRVRDDVAKVSEYIVEQRRHFHRHPELSFQEVKTAAHIAAQLRGLPGVEVTEGVGKTGVVGLLRGAHDGPCIALRADMDALPVLETTGLPFASETPGVMHACGHDTHMAMMLGTAQILSAAADRIHGSVKFVFQPAEEGHHGAPAMIADGVLEGVDEIYGCHTWTYDKVGTVGVKDGPVMACSDRFDITVKGKGGHGAVPQGTCDAIIVAAALVTQLQTIVSRCLDPTSSGVVSVCQINGGKNYNVICDEVQLVGTARCFTAEGRDTIIRRMEELCAGIGAAHGAAVTLKYTKGYPPTVNAYPDKTAQLRAAAEKIVGGGCHDPYLTMAAEDFSYFLQERPGCWFFVGSAPPGAQRPHHKSNFTVDESSLLIGTSVFVQLIEDKLMK